MQLNVLDFYNNCSEIVETWMIFGCGLRIRTRSNSLVFILNQKRLNIIYKEVTQISWKTKLKMSYQNRWVWNFRSSGWIIKLINISGEIIKLSKLKRFEKTDSDWVNESHRENSIFVVSRRMKSSLTMMQREQIP